MNAYRPTRLWTPQQVLRVLPNALDFWVGIAIVLAAFDKPIPWFLWMLIVGEFAVFYYIGHENQS